MNFKRLFALIAVCLILVGAFSFEPFSVKANAAEKVELRRVINNEAPAWIVHIDTWTSPDPQRIIELIPEEIRPYVIFNLSMSVSGHDSEEGFGVVEYAYETCKSWLRTCAENGVWATVQPASGGPCHFPDYKEMSEYDNTLYREFFEDYPNFLGFNYSEQFWGYDMEGISPSCHDRYLHFANLLEITHEYGGYLFVSWCGNQWSPAINPLAMLKQVPEWEEASRLYAENYILCEKYTQTSYLADMESVVLGAYLSGYCGQWGVRYDETGWTPGSGSSSDYTMSTGLAVEFERMLLNGATVIDGPELVFEDDFKEIGATTDEDGWTARQWESLTVFKNVAQDLIYKVIDGTIDIPTKEEVIERTKVIIINDIESGDIDAQYSIPETLTEGLYRAEGDGNLRDNHSFYKSSGRYATIPMAYALEDNLAYNIDVILDKSDYKSYWPTIEDKVAEFNELYPELYTGDMYVGNRKNGWVAYNPYKAEQTSSASVPLLYNSCSTMELEFSRYGSAVIKEQADSLNIYINNYDDNNILKSRENVITVTGCSEEPTYTYTDRGFSQMKSKVNAEYSNGTFTLTIKHNGPVDITINCKGAETDKLEAEAIKPLTAPAAPPVYTGPYQYEAECFEYQNVTVIKNGARGPIDNYTGQGYMNLGTSKDAKVRDVVTALEKGKHLITVRYTATNSPSDLVLYVNGKSAGSLELEATGNISEWKLVSRTVDLKAGENTIEIRSKSGSGADVYIDNMIVEALFDVNTDNINTDADSSPVVIGDMTWLIVALAAVIVVAGVIIIVTLKKK